MKNETADGMDRRSFLAKSAAAAATIAMVEPLAAQTTRKRTFTILHTNDLHSNLVGMAPVTAIPKFTGGKLSVVAKNKHGQPLQSRVEAIAAPAQVTPDLLPQNGTSIDVAQMVEVSAEGAPVEIKEWQAIMQYLQALPAPAAGELPVVPTDARATEPRFIRVG